MNDINDLYADSVEQGLNFAKKCDELEEKLKEVESERLEAISSGANMMKINIDLTKKLHVLEKIAREENKEVGKLKADLENERRISQKRITDLESKLELLTKCKWRNPELFKSCDCQGCKNKKLIDNSK